MKYTLNNSRFHLLSIFKLYIPNIIIKIINCTVYYNIVLNYIINIIPYIFLDVIYQQ